MRSLRGTLTSKTREAIFSIFGEENLPSINTNASPSEIAKWKKTSKVSTCYKKLFKKINDNDNSPLVLTCIIWKVSNKKKISNVEMAFVCVICVSVLNPKYSKLKLSTKTMKRKIRYFLVSFIILFYLKLNWSFIS